MTQINTALSPWLKVTPRHEINHLGNQRGGKYNTYNLLHYLTGIILLSLPVIGMADNDLVTLHQQFEEQSKLLQLQQKTLAEQAAQLKELSTRLAEMEGEANTEPTAMPLVKTAAESQPPETKTAESREEDQFQRGSEGDMNSAAITAGDFPGSFKIPGTGEVSLAIDGFIKTVAIVDTNAEDAGADFLPAFLGTRRKDNDGNFTIDSTISRLDFDVRAPAPQGTVRGYLEFDMNNTNNSSLDLKVRHAYGAWKSNLGTLTMGHTWSTLMDMQILPEGVTEPTVSGVIFQRQPMLRWSQSISERFKYDFAIEDPSSNDVFRDEKTLGNSVYPDVILAGEYNKKETGHFRLAGIYRRIEVDKTSGGNSSANGWGVSFGSHLNTVDKDRAIFSGSYGKGLGRYLLGITPDSGGTVNATNGNLSLRTNYGGMIGYQRYWSDRFRSSFAVGRALADTTGEQPGSAFSNSTYAYGNLMWNVLPYLSFGIEYDFGQRENKDNSTINNHRIMFGAQIF